MLTECGKASVYSLDGVYITEVRVVDAHKESLGLIFEEEDMDKVNTESIIVFYDGVQGLVTCKCSLSGRVKIDGTESGDINDAIYKVPCQINERISIEQRRNDLKVKVSFPVVLEIIDAKGEVTHIPAKMKDISAGGIGLESAEAINDNQDFSFLFDTEIGCTRLKASILWGQRLTEEDEPPLYRYGGRFIDVTSYQESMVRKFTFQEQLKRRKVE